MEKQMIDPVQLHREDDAAGRLANLDLLRIVAMMFIAVLHFLWKGEFLPSFEEERMSVTGMFAWGLEALAIVAVNCYMLLSGYFLSESTFKWKRLIGLWLQILFYSLGIGLIGIVFGLVPAEGFSVSYLLELLLPVSAEHYWFMTAYFLMYLFVPFLTAGVKKLTKRQFQAVLFAVLAVFSGVKSIAPVRLAADRMGYDCLWYICLFLTAAYIRRYGIVFLKGRCRCAVLYVLAAAAVWGLSFGIRAVWLRTGKLESILSVSYEYNHILVWIASVAFFCLFLQIRPGGRTFCRCVGKIAPYTLGVYLLHEHIMLRYRWPAWLMELTGRPEGIGGMAAVLVFAVLCVFAAGIFVDFLRHLLFSGMDRALSRMGWYRRLTGWLDGLTAGTGNG